MGNLLEESGSAEEHHKNQKIAKTKKRLRNSVEGPTSLGAPKVTDDCFPDKKVANEQLGGAFEQSQGGWKEEFIGGSLGQGGVGVVGETKKPKGGAERQRRTGKRPTQKKKKLTPYYHERMWI